MSIEQILAKFVDREYTYDETLHYLKDGQRHAIAISFAVGAIIGLLATTL